MTLGKAPQCERDVTTYGRLHKNASHTRVRHGRTARERPRAVTPSHRKRTTGCDWLSHPVVILQRFCNYAVVVEQTLGLKFVLFCSLNGTGYATSLPYDPPRKNSPLGNTCCVVKL